MAVCVCAAVVVLVININNNKSPAILRQISKNSAIFHTKGIEITSCMGHTQTNHSLTWACVAALFVIFLLFSNLILMKFFIGRLLLLLLLVEFGSVL